MSLNGSSSEEDFWDVTIVCGVIEYKRRILIGKQVEGEHPADLGGKWHFPSGRVEEGESVEAALRREVRE
jgi:8-oxo-dGTP pyrophosphatase MutT (NUDIX family)